MHSRDFGKAGRFKCVPRMFWYDLTLVATKCALLYIDRNILRYSLGLRQPWHAGHVEITGEKKMGAGLLWRHRQTCLLFRDRSDVEHGCIFRPIVFYTIVRTHENLLYGPV